MRKVRRMTRLYKHTCYNIRMCRKETELFTLLQYGAVSTSRQNMYSERRTNDAADLDTAITLAGLGKFHLGLAMVGAGCIAASTVDSLGNGFLLPSVTCEFELSAVDKGLYSGATFSGMVLTTYGWGSASDTFGRRKALFLALGFSWLSSFCASLAPIFWLMVTLRFLTGIASAALSSIVFAYVSEFFPPKKRTKYFSWAGVFVGTTYCLMPGVTWLILPHSWSFDLGFVVLRSWRILSILSGVFMLVTFFGLLMLPESPKYLVSVDKPNEAIDVLRKIFSINTGYPADEYPVRAIEKTINDVRTVGTKAKDKLSALSILKTMKDQIVLIFGRNHIYTTMLACVLQFCIYASSGGFYLWMPDVLNHVMAYNIANPNSTATICTAIATQLPIATSSNSCQNEMNPIVLTGTLATGVYYTMIYVLLASLVNVVGKRRLLATLQLTSGIAGCALYWSNDLTLATIFSTVYIVQSGVCLIPLSTMLSDLYPTHLRSAALCIAMTVGRFGAGLVGAIFGIILEYDCTSTIFGLGALCISNGLLIFLLPMPAKEVERTDHVIRIEIISRSCEVDKKI